MTVVGILSDTHGNLPLATYAELADADVLIHAGDIGSVEVYTTLTSLAPTYAVLGNNDYAEYGSGVGRFAHPVIDGVKFLVGHYPQSVTIGFNGCAGLAAGDPIPDVCIHGHTHIPRLDYGPEARPASFVLNPGSVSRPRGGNPASLAKMVIEDGRIVSIAITSLQGHTLLQWPPVRSGVS